MPKQPFPCFLQHSPPVGAGEPLPTPAFGKWSWLGSPPSRRGTVHP